MSKENKTQARQKPKNIENPPQAPQNNEEIEAGQTISPKDNPKLTKNNTRRNTSPRDGDQKTRNPKKNRKGGAETPGG